MTIASTRTLLLDHAGHTMTVIENTREGRIGLRCRSTGCPGYNRIVDLTVALGQATAQQPTTSGTRAPTPIAEQCPTHPGEYRTACRCCAAESKALPDGVTRTSETRTGVDPTTVPAWQAARADLAARTTERRRQERAASVSGSTLNPDQPAATEGSPT